MPPYIDRSAAYKVRLMAHLTPIRAIIQMKCSATDLPVLPGANCQRGLIRMSGQDLVKDWTGLRVLAARNTTARPPQSRHTFPDGLIGMINDVAGTSVVWLVPLRDKSVSKLSSSSMRLSCIILQLAANTTQHLFRQLIINQPQLYSLDSLYP